MKKENGVTLVALVVTIIVLLILAGVTINMVAGQNGIIEKTKNAKKETIIAEIIENAKSDVSKIQIENQGRIPKKEFKETLKKYGEISEDGEDKVLITNDNYKIKVSDIYDGTLEVQEIHFTIDRVLDCKAEEGMTWREWFGSSYQHKNVGLFGFYDDCIAGYATGPDGALRYGYNSEDGLVLPDDEIIDGHGYCF